MPVMSRYDLIRAIRANPLLQAIPILVVSAVPEALVRDKSSSVAAFVQKPFRKDGRDGLACPAL
jgi:CheY-like chemotaxis protein